MLDIRRRTGYLFLFVVIGHIVLISAQVTTKAGVPVLEAVTFGLFSEIQRGTSTGVGGVKGIWDGYIALRNVRTENEALHRQMAAMEIELQKQRALALQGHRLQALLNLRTSIAVPTVAAQVIAGDARLSFQTLTIDKGTRDGVRVDMAVVSQHGVVGRVVKAGARAALVQLLIDREAAAGAIVERSRAGGVVVGAMGDPPLDMEYMSNLADVKPADRIVTSGLDGIYPKGFTIGRVESVERGAGLYKSVKVRPSVDFSRIEEVLVVTAPPSPAVDQSEMNRAESPTGGERKTSPPPPTAAPPPVASQQPGRPPGVSQP